MPPARITAPQGPHILHGAARATRGSSRRRNSRHGNLPAHRRLRNRRLLAACGDGQQPPPPRGSPGPIAVSGRRIAARGDGQPPSPPRGSPCPIAASGRRIAARGDGHFILSLMARLESLQFGTAVGWLKISGVLVSVGGTMIISLYKGKVLHLWPSISQHHNDGHLEVATHQLRGTIFLVGGTITFACWYLIQSKVLKVYPYKYWSSMATCFVGGLQTLLFGIIMRRDRRLWKLGWDIQLATVAYSGALATAGKYSQWILM